jgi:hypothetical protein
MLNDDEALRMQNMPTTHEMYLESEDEDDSHFTDTVAKGEPLAKFIQETFKSYPHSKMLNKETKVMEYTSWSFFCSKTGCFSCFESNRISDFQGHGSGVVLYLQFLKHMTACFFVLFILSIFSL